MVYKSIFSPNYDQKPIQVEFLVLHYTAGELERTLELFVDPSTQVSSHLVVSKEGEVFELVQCWDELTLRAWHAGSSTWFDGQQTWRDFNDFAIGIELVNLNGNIFPYTDRQYEALEGVVEHLKAFHPALRTPTRVLGHEQIAGRRGKADPGCMFDWKRFFHSCYPDQTDPVRPCVCPPDLRAALERFLAFAPADIQKAVEYWHAVSHITETAVRLLQEATSQPATNRDSLIV